MSEQTATQVIQAKYGTLAAAALAYSVRAGLLSTALRRGSTEDARLVLKLKDDGVTCKYVANASAGLLKKQPRHPWLVHNK